MKSSAVKVCAWRKLYLAVHEKFGGESVRISHTLPRSVLYLLARPSTPDEVREEAIERAEAGERLTLAEVKEKVEAAQEIIRSEALAEIQRLTKARDDAAREIAYLLPMETSDARPAPKPIPPRANRFGGLLA